MAEYLAWCSFGGIVGIAAALLVLRHRGALTAASAAVFPLAALACFYGAKVQYRLHIHPVAEALLVPPHELLQPGLNAPLGLGFAVVAAWLACWLLRVSRLQILDALAMGLAVAMPIGRIGCLRAGCCKGAVCPHWFQSLCVQPDSPVVMAPMASGDVVGHVPALAAVHLLPVYFAVLGIGLALLYLFLLRRGVRPGTLIAVQFFAYPLGQLAIEQLRTAAESRGSFMTAMLLAMIAIDVAAVSAWVAMRPRRRTWFVRDEEAMPRRVVAAALALMICAPPLAARAQLDEGLQRRWQSALQAYAQDPYENLPALLSVGRAGTEGLPPAYRVTLGDAHLRAGHLRKAAQLFDGVLAANPGEPWSSFAALGRGWVAVRRGKLGEAREFFSAATEAPGGTGLMADFMVGFVDAENTGGAAAAERFDRIAQHPNASENLRLAAMMAGGYAKFWSGDDAGAEAAFREVAERTDGRPVADDARYVEALARWRGGDRDGAEEALRTLAASAPTHGPRVSGRLQNLAPRDLVRASARRYRRLPLGMPSELLLSMLSGDAPSQARIALRRLVAGGDPPSVVLRRSSDVQRAHSSSWSSAGTSARSDDAASSGARVTTKGTSTWPLVLVMVALAATTVWWSVRRRAPRR